MTTTRTFLEAKLVISKYIGYSKKAKIMSRLFSGPLCVYKSCKFYMWNLFLSFFGRFTIYSEPKKKEKTLQKNQSPASNQVSYQRSDGAKESIHV